MKYVENSKITFRVATDTIILDSDENVNTLKLITVISRRTI